MQTRVLMGSGRTKRVFWVMLWQGKSFLSSQWSAYSQPSNYIAPDNPEICPILQHQATGIASHCQIERRLVPVFTHFLVSTTSFQSGNASYYWHLLTIINEYQQPSSTSIISHGQRLSWIVLWRSSSLIDHCQPHYQLPSRTVRS